jgi:preprotein translocase subunit YajC
METLIISVIFSVMIYGFYLLKKQSNKTRQRMIDEMEDEEQ